MAVNCNHLIRTANHPLGHHSLTLRNLTATNCLEPLVISNTKQVRVENLRIVNEPEAKKPRITLRNCNDVELRDVTIMGLSQGKAAVSTPNSTNVRIEGLMR